MDWLIATVLGLLAGGGGAATVVWLAKSVLSERIKNSIKHEYDVALKGVESDMAKQLAVHKSELDSRNSIAVERLRSQLDIQRLERELHLRNITEKRAEVIGELHDYLMRLQDALESYTAELESAGEPSKEEKREAIQAIGKEFDPFFRRNCLFLPEELENRIRTYLQEYKRIRRQFNTYVEGGMTDRPGEERNHWGEAAQGARNQLRPIQEELKAEFRRLLEGNPVRADEGS